MPTARALISSLSLPLLLLVTTSAAPFAAAQSRSSPAPDTQFHTSVVDVPPPAPDLNANGDASKGSDIFIRQMYEKMARERGIQRHKLIVAQSAQLLALAKQLNDDIAKSNKNQLPVPVVKEAAEIEKLAKSIKSKMQETD